MGEVDNCQSKHDLATFTSLPHFSFLSLDPKVSPEIAMQQCKSYNNSTRFLFSLLSPPHHALSLSLSDCFLVLFCFQARGSQGGYAKTPWQASMATQKAWDFCRMHLNALNALNTDRRSRLKSIVKEVLRTVNRRSGRLCRLCVDYRRRNWVSLGVFELQAAKTWRELYETQGRPCPKPILGTELSLSPGSSRWYIVHNAKILKHLETLCNPR